MHATTSHTRACATRAALLPAQKAGDNTGLLDPEPAAIDPVSWLHLRRGRARTIERYKGAWRWGVVCGLCAGVPAGMLLCAGAVKLGMLLGAA